MIRATTRQCLTRNDAQLAIRLLAGGLSDEQRALEQRLRDGGLDTILDDPRLADRLVQDGQGRHASAGLFFYVLVRKALCDAGEPNRQLADFVSTIVMEFGNGKRAHRVRQHDDVEYPTLASLAGDLDTTDPVRGFLVRVHMGNFALWYAGLFPDCIDARAQRRGGPELDYYDEMGQRGYALASEHRLAAQHGVADVMGALAARFPTVRTALNRVSDRVFFPRHFSVGRILRQVTQ